MMDALVLSVIRQRSVTGNSDSEGTDPPPFSLLQLPLNPFDDVCRSSTAPIS